MAKKKQSKYIRDEYGDRELTIAERKRKLGRKKSSPKQMAQQKKFKKATKVCKGSKDYRGCMKTELKK